MYIIAYPKLNAGICILKHHFEEEICFTNDVNRIFKFRNWELAKRYFDSKKLGKFLHPQIKGEKSINRKELVILKLTTV